MSLSDKLATFEALCEVLYGPVGQAGRDQPRRQQADLEIKQVTENYANINLLRFFLENSTSKWVQFVTAAALKQLFCDHYCQIPQGETISLKESLLNFLATKGCSCDQ